MLKRITTMALTGAVILGASVAAQAQSASSIGDYRSSYRDYARSGYENGPFGRVGRGLERPSTEDDTASGGNASPPAGGIGRVNSQTQQ